MDYNSEQIKSWMINEIRTWTPASITQFLAQIKTLEMNMHLNQQINIMHANQRRAEQPVNDTINPELLDYASAETSFMGVPSFEQQGQDLFAASAVSGVPSSASVKNQQSMISYGKAPTNKVRRAKKAKLRLIASGGDQLQLSMTGYHTAAPKAPKKMNAFIGFRAYYCVIFEGLEQQDRSTMVSQLWAHDMFAPEWAVIASAYSTIRDQVGKKNAPLKSFLNIIVPYVGLPRAEIYLEAYGWTMKKNTMNVLNLRKPESFPARVEFGVNGPVIEADLISFANSQGYPGIVPSASVAATNAAQTVTVTPQEAVPPASTSNVVDPRDAIPAYLAGADDVFWHPSFTDAVPSFFNDNLGLDIPEEMDFPFTQY